MQTICVYCGSSTQVDEIFFRTASDLGRMLAQNGDTLVYGGGSLGLMGELAQSALRAGGRVVGVIPRFMYEENWHMEGLSELLITTDMHERKQKMAGMADAFVALPGGCGTLEELMEIITWKQLGLVTQPIIIVNADNYYTPLLQMLDRAVEKHFMRERHRDMWTVVESAEEVLPAIEHATAWDTGYRKFAAI